MLRNPCPTQLPACGALALCRYKKEGIPWEEVSYFDNEIICQMIESPKNPVGLITVLDDICLGPGGLGDKECVDAAAPGLPAKKTWGSQRARC